MSDDNKGDETRAPKPLRSITLIRQGSKPLLTTNVLAVLEGEGSDRTAVLDAIHDVHHLVGAAERALQAVYGMAQASDDGGHPDQEVREFAANVVAEYEQRIAEAEAGQWQTRPAKPSVTRWTKHAHTGVRSSSLRLSLFSSHLSFTFVDAYLC